MACGCLTVPAATPTMKGAFSMSNQHKHPTISFRISDAERKQIEARILASGMMKKDYFVRSCIYNRICVVGKKETIYTACADC